MRFKLVTEMFNYLVLKFLAGRVYLKQRRSHSEGLSRIFNPLISTYVVVQGVV